MGDADTNLLTSPDESGDPLGEALALQKVKAAVLAFGTANIGMLLAMAGEHELALERLVLARELLAAQRGPDDPKLLQLRVNIAEEQLALGLHQPVLAGLDEVLAIQRDKLGEAHPDLAATLTVRAEALRAAGREDEALASARAALAIKIEALGAGHPGVAKLREFIAVSASRTTLSSMRSGAGSSRVAG